MNPLSSTIVDAMQAVAGASIKKVISGFDGSPSLEAVAILVEPLVNQIISKKLADEYLVPSGIPEGQSIALDTLKSALCKNDVLNHQAALCAMWAWVIPIHFILDAKDISAMRDFYSQADSFGLKIQRAAPSEDDPLIQIIAEMQRVDVECEIALAALALLLPHDALLLCHKPDYYTPQV